MALLIYIKYKPSYKVTLNGQTLGYVESKKAMEALIEDYKNNISGNIAYITINDQLDYELQFVSNSSFEDDSEAILVAVQNNSTVTCRTYAINVDGKETARVETEAEAMEIVDSIDSDKVTVTEVYSDQDSAEESIETLKVALASVEKKVEDTVEKDTKTTTTSRSSTTRSTSSSKSSSSDSNASSTDFAFPVKGCSISNISNKTYPSYSGHTGIDVNINVTGKSVVAVMDGTVITSTALKTSSGAYRSYGEYIMIKHSNGMVTVYAHLKAGSRLVSVGDKVTKGQAIGTVGATGNATGTHLHFEVRVNGKAVNPLPYLK